MIQDICFPLRRLSTWLWCSQPPQESSGCSNLGLQFLSILEGKDEDLSLRKGKYHSGENGWNNRYPALSWTRCFKWQQVKSPVEEEQPNNPPNESVLSAPAWPTLALSNLTSLGFIVECVLNESEDLLGVRGERHFKVGGRTFQGLLYLCKLQEAEWTYLLLRVNPDFPNKFIYTISMCPAWAEIAPATSASGRAAPLTLQSPEDHL